jgi:primary-amine oxidase
VPPESGVIEVVVLLSIPIIEDKWATAVTGTVVSWLIKPEVQAMFTPDDCFDAEAIGKADPQVIKLLETKFGITDLSMVVCDPWSIHAEPTTGRLIQLFCYLRVGHEMDNAYAHPIGMVPIVDVYLKKVIVSQLSLISFHKYFNIYDFIFLHFTIFINLFL